VFAGSVTAWVTLPEVQGTEFGSPTSDGDELKLHVVAFFTTMLSVEFPPEAGIVLGMAANEVMFAG
jgi:hypothetical protein